MRYEAVLHSLGDFIVHLTGTPGYQHHDQLSHSVTLSKNWANQFLPYPNNAECQVREQQVSILKSLGWLNQGSKTARSGFEPATFGFPVLPEKEADALLVRPPRLVMILS